MREQGVEGEDRGEFLDTGVFALEAWEAFARGEGGEVFVQEDEEFEVAEEAEVGMTLPKCRSRPPSLPTRLQLEAPSQLVIDFCDRTDSTSQAL